MTENPPMGMAFSIAEKLEWLKQHLPQYHDFIVRELRMHD